MASKLVKEIALYIQPDLIKEIKKKAVDEETSPSKLLSLLFVEKYGLDPADYGLAPEHSRAAAL